MKCPYCQGETKVADSRAMDESNAIRRRRICENCGERFTTYERIERTTPVVVKRDASREPFDREKILAGVIKSCNKRRISMAQMEKIADEIENTAQNEPSREIYSECVGDMVMDALRVIDQVAYVRFASVYKQFTDVSTFMEEIKKLLDDGQNI